MFTGVMSEDALIRYENLEALCVAKKWGPSELAAKIDRSVSQASDMLRRKKAFGEKLARHIEHELGLPRNWLDVPHDSAEVLEASSSLKSDARNKLYLAATEVDSALHEVRENAADWVSSPRVPQNEALSATTAGRAPVVEWARLGEDLYKSNQQFRDDELRFYTGNVRDPNTCKFVQAPDDSLSPKVIRGDFILFDVADKRPGRDRIALFKGPDGGYLIRRYRPLADGDFEAYDEAGRALEGRRHALTIEGTFVTLQRDDA